MSNSIPLWSSILHDLLKSSYERQRLIAALGVADMTLIRWANGESNPHRSHLIRLLQVVQAQYRQPLLEALELEFPDIRALLKNEASEQISPHFFAEVIDVLTTTAENLRFWRITDMVLRQALIQLDPYRLGMSIQVVQCVPPGEGKKVRSIRTTRGRGASPWTDDLEHALGFGFSKQWSHQSSHTSFPRKREPGAFSSSEIGLACMDHKDAGFPLSRE